MTTYDSRFTINGCPDGTVQEEESVGVDGRCKMDDGRSKKTEGRRLRFDGRSIN